MAAHLVVPELSLVLLGSIASDCADHIVYLPAYSIDGSLCVSFGLCSLLLGYSFIVLRNSRDDVSADTGRTETTTALDAPDCCQ